MTPTLGIIGAGKVGSVLARLSTMRGYRVVAVYSRDAAKAAALAQHVGATVAGSPSSVVTQADLTLLTVTDDAIAEVVLSTEFRVLSPEAQGDQDSELSTQHSGLSPKAVIHTSGAHGMDVLAPLAGQVMIGSLHPAYPFADVERAIAGLNGAAYALEADDERLRGWLHELVTALGGHAIDIPRGEKALYHASLVFASNYAVGLYALAERLLVGIGAEKGAADAALNALLAGTVRNLAEQSVPNALTGPLVRGDAGTIAAHLAALERTDTDAAALYLALALATLPLVEARGTDSAAIRRALLGADTARRVPTVYEHQRNGAYWTHLDTLIDKSEIVIDRPAGSAHPRYPNTIYPLDYGYLEGTTSGDGHGIDLFRGAGDDSNLVGIVAIVDLQKRDAEVKLLLGCTVDEIQIVVAFLNNGDQAALLIKR